MREVVEGITILEADAFYNLLPRYIRSKNLLSLRALMGALTASRNANLRNIADLSAVPNPEAAFRVSPERLLEDPALYREYLALVKVATKSKDDLDRIKALEEAIPNSVLAASRENSYLRESLRGAGDTEAVLDIGVDVRQFLRTSTPRTHLKGTHSWINAVALATGVFDAKAVELWSRYLLKDPDWLASPANFSCFSTLPQHYPTVGSRQYPLGSPLYEVSDLGDSELVEEVIVEGCSVDPNAASWINRLVEERNPFGAFDDPVTAPLVPGLYELHGGGSNTRASVSIRMVGGGSVRFIAKTFGIHGNSIRVRITVDGYQTQKLSISGSNSSIKFKSSAFDRVVAIDPDVLVSLYRPILVTKTSDPTEYDEQLNRQLPWYPVTNIGDQFVKADPAFPHYQIDVGSTLKAISVLRNILEEGRPAIRQVRQDRWGLCLRDQVAYAPILLKQQVILGSEGGLWRLAVVAGRAEFQRVYEGDIDEVFQRDTITGRYIRWAVDRFGKWSPETLSEEVGLQRTLSNVSVGGSLITVENLFLTASSNEALFRDSIHTDGTSNEDLLGAIYRNRLENPPDSSRPFMSPDSHSDDTADGVQFQSGPEDDLIAKPTLVDFSNSHIDSHFGVEEAAGTGGGDWFYWPDGRMQLDDIRTRSAGVSDSTISPVPSGHLRYGYPVLFLNYHNKVVWRDRVTNEPRIGRYRYDSLEGAAFESQGIGGDGPIEGSSVGSIGGPNVPAVGDGATPNDQIQSGFPITMLIQTRLQKNCRSTISYTSVSAGTLGRPRFSFRLPPDIAIGSYLTFPESSPYFGVSRVTASGSNWVETDEQFTENDAGSFQVSFGELLIVDQQDITITLRKLENLGSSTFSVYQRQPDSSSFSLVHEHVLTASEATLEVNVFGGHEVVLFGGGRSPFSAVVEAPQNHLNSLAGTLMAQSSRVVVGATFLDNDDERFWTYDQGSNSDYLIQDGVAVWRGGRWRGDDVYETSERGALPGVLQKIVSISPTSFENFLLGDDVNIQFEMSSGEAVWSILFGTPPTGLSLTSDGVLTGTVTAAGIYSFGIRAVSGTDIATALITMTVQASTIVITPSSLPDVVVGEPYEEDLLISGGSEPYSASLSGSLPAGFTWALNGSVITISGTATSDVVEFGLYSVEFSVEDADGSTAFQAISLTVPGPSEPAFEDSSGIITVSLS